ncbi:hypothetical protein [Piscinibacter sp. HJYY11]|uniref:hypothetical protein n=1 Tax=Piscinibacter sp. HJYY11 TaxID=2801333 RepID=UPI00191DE699|nr:hypothetical protein [Piscinibacter sp. HJYY11]MBL0727293.1 hypothetical protein [Piscinibacter sp. HJYY11]
MTFTIQPDPRTNPLPARPVADKRLRGRLRDFLLSNIDVVARAVLRSDDARRDAFLSASVDMKDYEDRLKRLEARQSDEARWF